MRPAIQRWRNHPQELLNLFASLVCEQNRGQMCCAMFAGVVAVAPGSDYGQRAAQQPRRELVFRRGRPLERHPQVAAASCQGRQMRHGDMQKYRGQVGV